MRIDDVSFQVGGYIQVDGLKTNGTIYSVGAETTPLDPCGGGLNVFDT